MGLRPLQQANELNAFQKKVLGAVDLPEAGEDDKRPVLDKDAVNAMFEQRLKLIVVDPEGTIRQSNPRVSRRSTTPVPPSRAPARPPRSTRSTSGSARTAPRTRPTPSR